MPELYPGCAHTFCELFIDTIRAHRAQDTLPQLWLQQARALLLAEWCYRHQVEEQWNGEDVVLMVGEA